MPKRHALTDRQWARIAPIFDRPTRAGRPWRDDRLMLDGILWIMKTGATWRDLPEPRFGPWQAVYGRFRRWRCDGTLDCICSRLQRDLDREGLIDWSAFALDSTSVRATRAASGARKRGSRAVVTPQRVWRWGGRVAVLRPRLLSAPTETACPSA